MKQKDKDKILDEFCQAVEGGIKKSKRFAYHSGIITDSRGTWPGLASIKLYSPYSHELCVEIDYHSHALNLKRIKDKMALRDYIKNEMSDVQLHEFGLDRTRFQWQDRVKDIDKTLESLLFFNLTSHSKL